MIEYSEKTIIFAGRSGLVDFELDAFANLQLDVTLANAAEIEIVIGEVLTPAGCINRDPGGYRIVRTMRKNLPAGSSAFDFDMPPHKSAYEWNPVIPLPDEAGGPVAPFRYVEITGAAPGDKAVLKRRELHGPCKDEDSNFKSSCSQLDRIWEFCKYTMKATSGFGCFIDGERERLPYEGDSYVNQFGFFCCSTDRNVPRNTVDWLLERPTWPTEWHLVMVLYVRDYILYTGDRSCLEKWRPLLEKSLLPENVTPDGLLLAHTRREGSTDIVDWPPEERDGYEHGEVNLVPSCYYYSALKAMTELYGDSKYEKMAERVKASIYRLMFDEKSGLFVDSPGSKHTALHSAFFPLYFDVADDPEPLKKVILSHGMDCSVYCAHFLVEACFRYGMTDHAMKLLTSRGLRSWQNMIDKGATMAMEAWDDSLKPNQDWNHAWGAAPAGLIPRMIGGITPSAPGFVQFNFDPHPGDLEYFTLKHPTPFGAITVDYRNGWFELDIPEGTCGIYRGEKLGAGKHLLK